MYNPAEIVPTTFCFISSFLTLQNTNVQSPSIDDSTKMLINEPNARPSE